jgi:hypothetical protein
MSGQSEQIFVVQNGTAHQHDTCPLIDIRGRAVHLPWSIVLKGGRPSGSGTTMKYGVTKMCPRCCDPYYVHQFEKHGDVDYGRRLVASSDLFSMAAMFAPDISVPYKIRNSNGEILDSGVLHFPRTTDIKGTDLLDALASKIPAGYSLSHVVTGPTEQDAVFVEGNEETYIKHMLQSVVANVFKNRTGGRSTKRRSTLRKSARRHTSRKSSKSARRYTPRKSSKSARRYTPRKSSKSARRH